MSDKGMRDEPQRQPAPQRDLYDYYQPEPQAGQPQHVQGDRLPPQRQQDYAPPTQRFHDEVYQQGYQQPRDGRAMRVPNGDNNINMVVYGDVYINQGGDVNARGGQNYDYRQPGGQQYDYRQYCAPNRSQPPVYYEGPHCRTGCGGQQRGGGGYQYYDGDTRGYYPQPVQRSGYETYQRGPTYSNDDVSGGRDGYRSSRQRYDGGSVYQGGGGYDGGYGTPPYVQQDNGMNQAGQVFDMVLKGADAYFGYDIARRYAKNDGRQGGGGHHGGYDRGGGRGGYDNRGGSQNGYGWNGSGGHYRVPPRNSQYYR